MNVKVMRYFDSDNFPGVSLVLVKITKSKEFTYTIIKLTRDIFNSNSDIDITGEISSDDYEEVVNKHGFNITKVRNLDLYDGFIEKLEKKIKSYFRMKKIKDLIL